MRLRETIASRDLPAVRQSLRDGERERAALTWAASVSSIPVIRFLLEAGEERAFAPMFPEPLGSPGGECDFQFEDMIEDDVERLDYRAVE